MAIYTIRVIGNVDARWSEWFDGLTISNTQPGEAMISGELVDQAALHGTLNKICNLNLALISVIKVDSGAEAWLHRDTPDKSLAATPVTPSPVPGSGRSSHVPD